MPFKPSSNPLIAIFNNSLIDLEDQISKSYKIIKFRNLTDKLYIIYDNIKTKIDNNIELATEEFKESLTYIDKTTVKAKFVDPKFNNGSILTYYYLLEDALSKFFNDSSIFTIGQNNKRVVKDVTFAGTIYNINHHLYNIQYAINNLKTSKEYNSNHWYKDSDVIEIVDNIVSLLTEQDNNVDAVYKNTIAKIQQNINKVYDNFIIAKGNKLSEKDLDNITRSIQNIKSQIANDIVGMKIVNNNILATEEIINIPKILTSNNGLDINIKNEFAKAIRDLDNLLDNRVYSNTYSLNVANNTLTARISEVVDNVKNIFIDKYNEEYLNVAKDLQNKLAQGYFKKTEKPAIQNIYNDPAAMIKDIKNNSARDVLINKMSSIMNINKMTTTEFLDALYENLLRTNKGKKIELTAEEYEKIITAIENQVTSRVIGKASRIANENLIELTHQLKTNKIVLKNFAKVGVAPENIAKIIVDSIIQSQSSEVEKRISSNSAARHLTRYVNKYFNSLYIKPLENKIQAKNANNNSALLKLFEQSRFQTNLKGGYIPSVDAYNIARQSVYSTNNRPQPIPQEIITLKKINDVQKTSQDNKGGGAIFDPNNIKPLHNERIQLTLDKIQKIGLSKNRPFLRITVKDSNDANNSFDFIIKKTANSYIVYDTYHGSQDGMDYSDLNRFLQTYNKDNFNISASNVGPNDLSKIGIVSVGSGFRSINNIMYGREVIVDSETLTEDLYMSDTNINKVISMTFTPVLMNSVPQYVARKNYTVNKYRNKTITILNTKAIENVNRRYYKDRTLNYKKYERFMLNRNASTRHNYNAKFAGDPSKKIPYSVVSLSEATLFSEPYLHEMFEAINNTSNIIQNTLIKLSRNKSEYEQYTRIIKGMLSSTKDTGYVNNITGNVANAYFGVSILNGKQKQSFSIPVTYKQKSLFQNLFKTLVSPNKNDRIDVANKYILPSNMLINPTMKNKHTDKTSAAFAFKQIYAAAHSPPDKNPLFKLNELDNVCRENILDAFNQKTNFTYNTSYVSKTGYSSIELPYNFSKAIEYLVEKAIRNQGKLAPAEIDALKKMTDLQSGINPLDQNIVPKAYPISKSTIILNKAGDKSMEFLVLTSLKSLSNPKTIPETDSSKDKFADILQRETVATIKSFYSEKAELDKALAALNKIQNVESDEYKNAYKNVELHRENINKILNSIFFTDVVNGEKQKIGRAPKLILSSFGRFDNDIIEKALTNLAGFDKTYNIPSRDIRSEIMSSLLNTSSALFGSASNMKVASYYLLPYMKKVGISNTKIKEAQLNLSVGSKYSTGYSVQNLYSLLDAFGIKNSNRETHFDVRDTIDEELIRAAANSFGEHIDEISNFDLHRNITDLYLTVQKTRHDILKKPGQFNRNAAFIEFNKTTKGTAFPIIASALNEVYQTHEKYKTQEQELEYMRKFGQTVLGSFNLEQNVIDEILEKYQFSIVNKTSKSRYKPSKWFQIEFDKIQKDKKILNQKSSIRIFDSRIIDKQSPTKNMTFDTYVSILTNVLLNDLADEGDISESERIKLVKNINNELKASHIISGYRQQMADTSINDIIRSASPTYASTVPSILFLGAMKIGESWFNKQKQKDIEKEAAYIYKKQERERTYVPEAISHNVSTWTIANRMFFSDFGSGANARLKRNVGASQAILGQYATRKLVNKTVAGITKLSKLFMDNIVNNPTNAILFGVGAGAIITTGLIAKLAVNHPRKRRNIKKVSANSRNNNYLETMRHDNIYTVINRKLYTGYGSAMEPVNVQEVASVKPGEATPSFNASQIRTDNMLVAAHEVSQAISDKGYPPYELIDIVATQEPGFISKNITELDQKDINRAAHINKQMPIHINKVDKSPVILSTLTDAINSNAMQEHYINYPNKSYAKNAFPRSFSLIKSDMVYNSAPDVYLNLPRYTSHENERNYLTYNAVRDNVLNLTPTNSNTNRYIDRNALEYNTKNNAIQYAYSDEYVPSYFQYPSVPNIPIFELSNYAGKQQFRYQPNLNWIRF